MEVANVSAKLDIMEDNAKGYNSVQTVLIICQVKTMVMQ